MFEIVLIGSVTGTLLVALVTGAFVHWLLQKWKYPPGPMGLPLVGNLLQIQENILHEEVFKMTEKYGPVVTINLGTMPTVIVNKIDAAMEVLVKKSTDFASRMRFPSAGMDTSRLTLNWAINHMVAFPDIQSKVQEEIDRVVGKERLPSVEDRPHLGYTEAVLHESMRLATVVPLGVPHLTTCDTKVAGHKVPKNTQVMLTIGPFITIQQLGKRLIDSFQKGS